MKVQTILKKGISTIFGVALVLIVRSNAVASGIQTQMDGMYSEMTNFTPPGVYESQRRGAISGGRFTYKNKIFNESLVSLTLPSAKGGCGGIDMFGGSFSYINSDQLVQLLRSVASNAKGYAFQLAMDNVCTGCMKWMNELQNKMQRLNQHFGNSCQLAQGLVTDTVESYKQGQLVDYSIATKGKGVVEDFFTGWGEPDGESTAKKMQQHVPDLYEKMIGNIVWEELKKNGASNWFSGGDDALLEAILSITGSVIIRDLEQDETASGETNPITPLPGNKISLIDLVEGNRSATIYSCSADVTNCIINASDTTNQVITGFRTRINDFLLGTASYHGVIDLYQSGGTLGNLSQEQQNLMANLPHSLGSLIRRLSVLSPDSARVFVRESTSTIALLYAKKMIDEAFRATRIALSSSRSKYLKKAIYQVNDSQSVIDKDFESLLVNYGSLSEKINHYNNLIVNIRKQRYLISELTSPSKTSKK